MDNKFMMMEPMKYWQLPKNKKMSDIPKATDYFASVKLDGEWLMAIKQGDEVLLRTRSLSKVTGVYGDKTEHFPHIAEWLKTIHGDTVLVGEVYYPGKTVQDTASITRCKAPKAVERQKGEYGWLSFGIFDVLMWNGEDLTEKGYADRIALLNEVEAYEQKDGLVAMAVPQPVPSLDTLAYWLNEILEAGEEGLMIIHKDAPYRPGKKKAWESIKLKKQLDDFDVEVVGLIEPKREYEGTESETWQYRDENGNLVTKYYAMNWKAGVIVDFNGHRVRVTSGLTDADAQWLAEEGPAFLEEGTLSATITGMEVSADGSIRHPRLIRLRTDK